jgi:hypothetical protein
MSCLEMPRGPAPDFLGEKERTFNDADTCSHVHLRPWRPTRAMARG